MEHMGKQRVYPEELKQRAARMVLEWRAERNRSDGGIKEVAEQLGVHAESVRNWVYKHQVDVGQRPGLTSDDNARITELERENRELRRANEILKSASAFFARELDPRPPR
jgi:transposase